MDFFGLSRSPSHTGFMKLADYIRSHSSEIMQEWENYARDYVPGGESMTRQELRDHISEMLTFITEDMSTPRTREQQEQKAKTPPEDASNQVGARHAEQRFRAGFDTLEVVSEFRALRASIVKLWDPLRTRTDRDYDELMRFTESTDQIAFQSLSRIANKERRSRSLLLGTLVHDMRSPLGSMANAIHIVSMLDNLGEKQKKLVELISANIGRLDRLISDLIDAVRIQLGVGIPLKKVPVDLTQVATHLVDEAKTAHPDREFHLVTAGNLKGEWDVGRIAELLSNLIGNAVQHGVHHLPVTVKLKGEDGGIEICVHNYGSPIPVDIIPQVFDPLVRHDKGSESDRRSLGLGLFIAREIVKAHAGEIEVISRVEEGTTFRIRLPRHGASGTLILAD